MQEVMEPILQIQVLGKFTLRYGETVISDEDDRSRKVWAVLAYLIYHREKIISQQELVDLCWGEDTRSSDPHNALKSVIHRIRATLDKLQEGLGRTLLRRKAGCYIWNTDVPLEVDAEVFDTLCSRGAALEGDERLDAYQQALALYSNDVLPKLSSELWLVPITTYYHQRYVQTAEESIQLLEEQDRLQEAILLARQAVRIEPYQERLYAQLIRTLLKMGNQKGAIAVYEEMSELFFSNFGVMPSDELRALYRKATRTVNNHALSVEDLRDQLKRSASSAEPCSAPMTFSRSSTGPRPGPWPAREIPRICACSPSPPRTAASCPSAAWTGPWKTSRSSFARTCERGTSLPSAASRNM